jgi:phospholipid/cholesterol/gamma-HCH transport system substrate-binding protein
MPSRLSWRHLLPGLIALAAVLVIAAGVLKYAGVGRVRGDKARIYVLTEQARGVMRGSDVWIAGQKVGLVDDIRFRPPSDDSLGRVVMTLSIREKDLTQIRRDSRPQVRAGANLIGPIVVYLTAGSAASPPVRPGDTLRAGPQSDFEGASSKLAKATDQLGPLMADARTVMARVRDRNGTVGAVMTEGLGGDVAALRANVTRMRARMSGSQARPALTARAGTALARVDSVRALLASPRSSYGRFRRDSTLMRTVGGLRDELTELRALLTSTDGTVGRFTTDSALAISIANARKEMTLLFADMRRRPLQYVQF